jgi:hypothetical protein
LQIDGQWLGKQTRILEASSFGNLLERLSDTRPNLVRNPTVTPIQGNAELGGQKLEGLRAELERLRTAFSRSGMDVTDYAESIQDIRNAFQNGAGLIHYAGHGVADTVEEYLAIGNNVELRTLDLESLGSVAHRPFVMLCACSVGNSRHGAGGFRNGIAERISEHLVPGVVGFRIPIPENRAYDVTRSLYQHGFRYPLGEAVRRVCAEQPFAYAWLSLAAFGEPKFELSELTHSSDRPIEFAPDPSWDCAVRRFATRRIADATEVLQKTEAGAPQWVSDLVRDTIVNDRAEQDQQLLAISHAENTVLEHIDALTTKEALSIAAGLRLSEFHAWGLFGERERWPPPKVEIVEPLLQSSRLVTSIGAVLSDAAVYGLGLCVTGTLTASYSVHRQYALEPFKRAIEALEYTGSTSSFLDQTRQSAEGALRELGNA